MNKKSRDSIKKIIKVLDDLNIGVNELLNRENESISNLDCTPLEDTDMYRSIEKSSEFLEDSISDIESAISNLESAMYPD